MRARASGRAGTVLVLLLVLTAPAAGALDLGSPSAGEARVIILLERPLSSWERADLALSGVVIERELTVTPAIIARVPNVAAMGVASKGFVLNAQPVEPLEFHLEGARAIMRAEAPAWDLPYSGDGVGIAVVDSGLDLAHPDLGERVRANVKFAGGRFVDSAVDATGHGTHVASIAAGSGAASGSVRRGVAPDAHLVGVDISSAFDTAAALEAFDWLFVNADRLDVRVVVAAWGRQARGERFDPDDALVRAADRLVDAGIVVVFSAANRGPGASTLSIEAQNPRVITVGATDDAGVVARYSSRGPALAADGSEASWVKPDFVAPGTRVVAARAATSPSAPTGLPALPGVGGLGGGDDTSALAGDSAYTALTGTSQSAPLVAGVVALMLEANPALTPAGVMNALRATAIDLGPEGPDPAYGFGLVDARDATLRASGRAPDRGNVLIAGGEESFAGAGRFLALSGEAIQTAPVLKPSLDSGAATLEFPVKANAERVELEFSWTPATSAAFRVHLTNGDRAVGPWSGAVAEDGRRVVRATVDARDLSPGEWTLTAQGTAAGDVAYDARVIVHSTPRTAAPSSLDPRYEVPGEETREDGFFGSIGHEWDVAKVRALIWMRRTGDWAQDHPIAAGGVALVASALGVAAVAGPTLLRGRRDEE